MSDSTNETTQVLQALSKLALVGQQLDKVVVGQQVAKRQLLVSILAGGHCLLEGVPGLAKTLMVSALGKTMALGFKRVQFTPDLMPSDIIGTEILETDHKTGDRFFKFQQGPVFTNILLADEINRTPPKTQAALLEAMQERRVSYAGQDHLLPKPFFVLATQNPVEQAGTYPLPEAQLDRFLMLVRMGYPSAEEETEILRRTTGTFDAVLEEVLQADDLVQLQTLVRTIEIAEPLLDYITRLTRSTRPQSSQSATVDEFVRWGAGPRAGQALVLCAKANALLDGRFSTLLDDVKAVAHSVLRHRILVNFQAEAQQMDTDKIIDALLEDVAPPTSPLV
jgi:MoxR-like ATPase